MTFPLVRTCFTFYSFLENRLIEVGNAQSSTSASESHTYLIRCLICSRRPVLGKPDKMSG
jgi:hypothetical protein